MQAAALSFVVGWIFFSAEFYNPFDTIQVSSHCLQTQSSVLQLYLQTYVEIPILGFESEMLSSTSRKLKNVNEFLQVSFGPNDT